MIEERPEENKAAENIWLNMEYDIAKSSTTSGVNTRLIFLGFLITINLAFYKGFYDLYHDGRYGWLLLLCFIVYIIDLAGSLIYFREHRMQDENHEQVGMIREKLMLDSGYQKLSDAKWLKFNEMHFDPFKGLTYYLIVFILSLLVSISLSSFYLALFKLIKYSTSNILIIISSIFTLFLVIIFLTGILVPKISRKIK